MIRRLSERKPTCCPILAPAFWRKGGKHINPALAFFLFVALLTASACHSYHIDSTIVNRTGAPVQLLEVDYPFASFGADAIAPGASFQYRFQVRGSGPLKLSYTGVDHKQIQITGPALSEGQQGQLRIVLLPAGKAQFLPRLTPPR
ncbi:conserved exported hypothetical protein [Candidatus Sulfotelmatomonas gaucii]|uniref:Uncharacterized protein n=1 Tax=Candidatus Sulfuritelmatomonas gaucii TaxID=2043161 RepID=A0A2N9LSS7_9BACT|nr:conserved exported hypothetical protein [Candidatus Sulfotelmatomonas gaucii]